MRTPREKAEHLTGVLVIAQAAVARAEQSIKKLEQKKIAAMQYALQTLMYVERGPKEAELKIMFAKARLAQAEHKNDQANISAAKSALALAQIVAEGCPAKVGFAKSAIAASESKYAFALSAAQEALADRKSRCAIAESNVAEAWADCDALEFKDLQETRETLRQMEQTNAYERREKTRLAAPKETELAEPPEGWAEFDRKANLEIQRKIAEKLSTNNQTDKIHDAD